MKKIILILITICTFVFTNCIVEQPNSNQQPNQEQDIKINISTLNNDYYSNDDIIIDIEDGKFTARTEDPVTADK